MVLSDNNSVFLFKANLDKTLKHSKDRFAFRFRQTCLHRTRMPSTDRTEHTAVRYAV